MIKKYIVIILFLLFGTLSYAEIHYVSLTGNAISPYTNWADASTNIQYAINIATSNETVLVTNGEYYLTAQLGFTKGGVLCIQVAAVSRLNIFSNNIIRDNKSDLLNNGTGGGACGGTYIGCQIYNNHATNGNGNGGGCYDVFITNCLIRNNRAGLRGGGCYISTIYNSTIISNWNDSQGSCAQGYGGGGVNACTVFDSLISYNGVYSQTLGGGALNSTLYRCHLLNNYGGFGGGATCSTLKDCIIENNIVYSSGGGVTDCNLENCRILNNTATRGSGQGGGMYISAGNSAFYTNINCTYFGNRSADFGGSMYANGIRIVNKNCIIVSNIGYQGTTTQYGTTNTYCLSKGDTLEGAGNLVGEPHFVDFTNFRLKSTFSTWSDTLQTWVIYPESSLAIDAGDPTSTYTNEPQPNGNRINMGYDGNTPQASKLLSGIWKYTDSFQSPTKILVPMK